MNDWNMNGNGLGCTETVLDMKSSQMTMIEVMRFIEQWKQRNPGREVWLDGDQMKFLASVFNH